MPKISRRNFLKTAAALSSMPLLATAQETKKEIVKFIHVTDSHMDLSDPDSVEAMELMAEFINNNYKDLDFVLFGGDNFNNNAPKDSDALKFKEIADRLHCPYYTVRGNKESFPSADKQINLKEFQQMFCSAEALHVKGKEWLLQTKGYNILGLDSCIENQNNGVYTPETIAFAEEILKQNRPTVILNHHPYTNYWGGTEQKDIHKYVLNNTDEVQKRLFKYDNLLVTLSGHKHIDSVKELQGTKVIVTRGFVRPLDLDMYPMRYVELDGTTVHEKLIYTS